jgi:hypothetical protein
VICNVLATLVDRSILDNLIQAGAVVDLVVLTLLRINAPITKEVLGKSLFNLLGRMEFRSALVLGGPTRGDLLTAMLELAKIDTPELVELCARIIYNISCEIGGAGVVSGTIDGYVDKLLATHASNWLISKLVQHQQVSCSIALPAAVANLGFANSRV